VKRKLKLALVGRPNVGKSALFNRICKQRIAIVDEAEGTTRDRLYAEADFFGSPFQVIDTAGIDRLSKALFHEEIIRQAEIAIEEADTLVMVVDAQVGITALDEEVARTLLRTKKPLCLAVNKIDDFRDQDQVHQFYSLGISRMVPVSATQAFHIAELLETAFEGFSFSKEVVEETQNIKVAIVGRPNVGKSTLVNTLLKEERCVVSPIAGTTRDSVDIDFEFKGVPFTLIDTAGIRKKNKEHEVVDKFAAIRTKRALERADVCLLMLDAERGLTVQDKRIATLIEESGKGCVLLFNKWDLVKGCRMEHCLKSVHEQVPFLMHCPTFFISAHTGRNLAQIFPAIQDVHVQLGTRISTGQLNKFVEKTIQKVHPPMIQGKRLRIYYMAQVEISPPHFVVFVNDPALMAESYKKYLINQFREQYGFKGAPLLFTLRGRKQKVENERSEPAKEVFEPLDDESEDLFDSLPDLHKRS
jgi:GTP-binding protein